jgi:hypothetical protein
LPRLHASRSVFGVHAWGPQSGACTLAAIPRDGQHGRNDIDSRPVVWQGIRMSLTGRIVAVTLRLVSCSTWEDAKECI